MIDRTARCFDLKPKRLIADTAYGTGKFLGWLVKEKRITPHIPVWDKSKREDGTFSRADFKWDRRANVYTCPNGKVLRTTGRVHEGMTLRFRASKYDCTSCPLKAQCCPNMPARQIPRYIHEDAREVARRKMTTKGVPQITRRAKAGGDAVRTSEDPSPVRAAPPQRPVRCPRRISSGGHRAEPEDNGAETAQAA